MKKYLTLIFCFCILGQKNVFATSEVCTNSVLNSVSFEIVASTGSSSTGSSLTGSTLTGSTSTGTTSTGEVTSVTSSSSSGGGGGAGANYSSKINENTLKNMVKTNTLLPLSIEDAKVISMIQDASMNTPSQKMVQILSSQERVIDAGETQSGYKIFSLQKRITDYICPEFVQIYEENQVDINDFSGESNKDPLEATVMFRGIEKNGLDGESAFHFSKNSGVTMNDGLFEPNREVTRAEYIKMIIRSLSCRYEYMGTDSGFPDVDNTFWYSEYITYATKNGWVHGYEDGNFYPNKSVTRAEAAKILSNAIRLTAERKNSSFQDVGSNNIFLRYIEALKENNVMRGVNENTFEREQSISRRDAARMIYRTFFGGM